MSDEAKKVVWVVEDELLIRADIADCLKQAGYEVSTYSTMDSAIRGLGYDPITKQWKEVVWPAKPYGIITDNNTNSAYKGMELMTALKGTNIGRVLHSAELGLTLGNVQEVSGNPARFQAKGCETEELVKLLKESAEAAALETLGIQQNPLGREP